MEKEELPHCYQKNIIQLDSLLPKSITLFNYYSPISILTMGFPHLIQMKEDLQFGSICFSNSLLENSYGWVIEPTTKFKESNWISKTNFYKNSFTKNCTIYLGVDRTKGSMVFTLSPDEYGNFRGILHTRNGITSCWVEKEKISTKSEKSIIKYLVRLADPEIQDFDFKVCKNQLELQSKLLSEESSIKGSSFGLVLRKDNQKEDDMFSNNFGSSDYEEFLTIIGNVIELKGWPNYTGGLDTKNNLHGTNSVYSKFQKKEIMFHVSTMLPISTGQQLERKSKIGNDVCVVVFNEGKDSYKPSTIVSQFIQVVVVVQVDSKDTYRVSVAKKEGINTISPSIPETLKKSEIKDFLLTKLINAEKASLNLPIFSKSTIKYRENFLKDLHDEFS